MTSTTPNTPANGGQILTDAMLSKAGRALADRSADSCNVNREDNWKTYGNEFIEDARVAFAAIEADLRDSLTAPAIPTVGAVAWAVLADTGYIRYWSYERKSVEEFAANIPNGKVTPIVGVAPTVAQPAAQVAVAEWINEEQGFQYLISNRLPDGTQLYCDNGFQHYEARELCDHSAEPAPVSGIPSINGWEPCDPPTEGDAQYQRVVSGEWVYARRGGINEWVRYALPSSVDPEPAPVSGMPDLALDVPNDALRTALAFMGFIDSDVQALAAKFALPVQTMAEILQHVNVLPALQAPDAPNPAGETK